MPKQTNQPQPQNAITEAMARAKAAPAKDKVVGIRGGPGLSEIRARERQELVQKKHGEEQRIRQKLAEIADLYNQGAASSQEAETQVADLATEMFLDIRDGIFQLNVISGMLGDTFGYRQKGDAKVRVNPGDEKASATPFGQGEAIRKRIVRAVQANDYVENDAPVALFNGIDKNKVKEILDRVAANDASIWTAYDQFGKLKTAGTNRAPAHLDPKRVAALTDGLSANIDKAAEAFASNPALCDAYGELREIIVEVDRAAAAIAKREAA